MTEYVFDFYSTDGTQLSIVDWNIDNPKGVIAFLHGHGEHKMRYKHVAEFFSSKGFASMAFDLRGHGISKGKKGHTPSMEQWLDDVEHFLMQVRSKHTEIPIILYGHSMGGNIGLNYLLKRRIDDIACAIITSALLKIAFEPPKWKVTLGKAMSNLWPSLAQPTGLNPEHISTDKEEVSKYKNDPLVHGLMSARMFVEIFDTAEWVLQNANKLKTPTLLLHGTADQINSVEGSKIFAEKSGDLSESKFWDGKYHELQNETNRKEVFQYELDWITTQLGF